MKKFKKLVILDKIILSDGQWSVLRNLAEEIIEYDGLTYKQVIQKLEIEQIRKGKSKDVCFTEFAVEYTSEEELNRRLSGADAVITCWTNIPDKVTLSNPQLRYIGFWTNLVSHRINLDLAKKKNIVVTYIPDYGTIAVAEYVFALILEMSRRVAKQAKDTMSGKWPYELLKTALYVPNVTDINYHTLCGRKLGIIGLGRIGQQVAKIAEGFGMEIAYFSEHHKEDWEKRGVKYLMLNDLMKWSDIVTVHLSPYAGATPSLISVDEGVQKNDLQEAFISKENIALLKTGSIFINTSAGRLIDEDALLNEAESGRIQVILDVYKSNPDRKRIQKIIQKYGEGRNIFTFRGGWLTQESIIRKGESLISNIKEFLNN
ncbi:MAG: NAD(P)-dependent oxidoreductase [Patescibacteria group bacterium]